VFGFGAPVERVQVSELKLPDESVRNATVPIGLDAPDEAVSLTVAVHGVDWPTTTGETHETLVLVGSMTRPGWVTFPGLTFCGRVSPVFLFTKTHLSVVPTLLGMQAFSLGCGGEGQSLSVFGVLPTTWRVMVKAKPEHGDVL